MMHNQERARPEVHVTSVEEIMPGAETLSPATMRLANEVAAFAGRIAESGSFIGDMALHVLATERVTLTLEPAFDLDGQTCEYLSTIAASIGCKYDRITTAAYETRRATLSWSPRTKV